MNTLIEKEQLEIRFAGMGGQGLQAAATVFGKSLLFSSGKFVCQSQNYGPESRGGLSYADLIISKKEIDFPKIKTPDVLVCMSQEAFLKFKSELIDGAVKMLIVDPLMVSFGDLKKKNPDLALHEVSATLASEEIAGNRLVANIVLVGALHDLLKLGDQNEIEKVIVDLWPSFSDINMAAFRRGIKMEKKK